MERQANRTPQWHSLMYMTGAVLIGAGIPATFIVVAFGSGADCYHLSRSEALLLGICMAAAVGIVGGSLLFAAHWVDKRRRKICGKDDKAA
jgi:hypothetical protein